MTKIIVIFTCFNRKEKTETCIKTLVNNNKNIEFSFVIIDDNSTDGTYETLINMQDEFSIHIIKGNGGLYYSRAMRLGMKYVIDQYKNKEYDYILLVNDDVEFIDGSISSIVEKAESNDKSVIVGATEDENGKLSYGGIRYYKNIKYKKVDIYDRNKRCDTFNANCVLISREIFTNIGIIDSKYIHSLGDFDYGLEINRHGYSIILSDHYVGKCNNNTYENTWSDTSLSRLRRFKLKETPKGLPFRQWFYFLNKNFGLSTAIIRSITPYIRIILNK